MIVVGVMSGTSMDGLDVAVGDFTLDGTDVIVDPLFDTGIPWPEPLRARLLSVLPPARTTVDEMCALDTEIGQSTARAVADVLADNGVKADLVASHGQTVFHWVDGVRALGTLQLGQPAWIVEATGLPVVSDIRARDIAAGGQGAPLASTLDALWLAGDSRRAALNLGGIANVTVVGAPGEPVVAFDTGPANCLLDVAAERILGCGFDEDGRIAATGTVRDDVLELLLAEPYYGLDAPKSTGRELFDRSYVADRLVGVGVDGPDLLATLTELTAVTVADAVRRLDVTEVVVSGGGVRNSTLMSALRRRLAPTAVVTSAERGLPPLSKEAYLVALLGFLTWNQIPGVVPGATGSPQPRVLGRISPGDAPMRLPEPSEPPRRLVVRRKPLRRT
ncbi:anhydro-N-acetylmuramic acid kinase [Rhodococcoides trifolii]|uniref:Anhydro-N-acetylmuramic acid kinase n=1 Tax=Rhodococcoides trifolii TaxID=908250 RepID=A0A917FN56_9NOCA|nr:anhydro-N-acetylmuramic acid kinase [Rhodococcus trifolii]GGF93875.1 anhydro-N-acetylmuramic acid kinase [Rhodococcus trifolii]